MIEKMTMQKLLIVPILGTFSFRTEHILVVIHSPRQFSNPVLLVVSTHCFHLDKNNKNFDPQPKMLRESESFQINDKG